MLYTAASLNALTSDVLAAAIRIHSELGPGLLETAYTQCLAHELHVRGQSFELQKPISLRYDTLRIDCAYGADIVVQRVVLIEVKATESIARVHLRQLRTYLQLADCRVGLLLNFGAPTMREGIRRLVHRFPRDDQ